MEIVAQHEHVALGRESSARRLVDANLDAAGIDARTRYRDTWAQFAALVADRDAVGGDRRALERELDLAAHQAGEIAGASLREGEDAELAGTLRRLRHAEEIAETLAGAHRMLEEEGGAGDLVAAAERLVTRAAEHDAALAPLAARVVAVGAEIAELVVDLRRAGDDVDHDASALGAAEERLAVLSDLRRKYGDTTDDVIAFGRAAAARAAELEGLLDRADRLTAEIATAEAAVEAAAVALRAERGRAAQRLAAEARGHLLDLGFATPVLEFVVEPAPAGPSGADRIRLMFASDEALEPGPVARIASGGELSRLVLAVRLAGGVGEAPVVAFDEIDAGVGGSTALAMGEKLAALARDRQVLVVTHLPQVAAFADTHIVVDRVGSTAAARTIDGAERVAELTRMLGGLPRSERGREHAEELVALATARRSL